MQIFNYLDKISTSPRGKLINQLVPIFTCLILFGLFMLASAGVIEWGINPFNKEKAHLQLLLPDIAVGFILYFVTAVDYALIVGRMTVSNPGSAARFVMNVWTCLGCFVGVTLVLLLWGFAKEIPLLIIPVLIIAGSVMIKIAHEGQEYFINAKSVPYLIRRGTQIILEILYLPTKILISWIPELGKPNTGKMSLGELAKWAFLLPFIIGIDDLVGYMAAMTVYNVFGLLFGIYLADIAIDMLIFLSPSLTKKLVENPLIAIFATYAFLYLAYKSFTEAGFMAHEAYDINYIAMLPFIALFLLIFGLLPILARKEEKILDSEMKK